MDANKLAALPVVADAKRALAALSQALREANYRGTSPEYRTRVQTLKADWDAKVTELRGVKEDAPGKLSETAVIGRVNERFGGKAGVGCAAGGLPGEILRLWRPEDPKAYHLEYGYSCMGYEIAGGLGVKLAEPEREVVVMLGDGSYLMMNSEIVTAVAEGIRGTIVLVDSHGFQCILGRQRPGGGVGCVRVDCQKDGEAVGALAIYAPTSSEVKAALERARKADRITVVVVPVDPESRMPGSGNWWDVPVAEVSSADRTKSTRVKYEEATKKQRPFLSRNVASASPYAFSRPVLPIHHGIPH